MTDVFLKLNFNVSYGLRLRLCFEIFIQQGPGLCCKAFNLHQG